MKPKPIPPAPGQESVWDYPRPPRLEATTRHIEVVFNHVVIADTVRALRILETSHPPVYYIPPQDIRMDCLLPSDRSTVCEWKGAARYFNVLVSGKQADNVAWTYPNPAENHLMLKDYIAFYPGSMDACYVDGEQVRAQPGHFYGGWITNDVVGPFKGNPGTRGW